MRINGLRGAWVLRSAGVFFFLSVLQLSWAASSGEYLVKLKQAAPFKVTRAVQGLSLMNFDQRSQIQVVRIESSKRAKVLAQLLQNNEVEYVVPNFELKRFDPRPAAAQEQWALTKVRAEEAWKLLGSKGSNKVSVAVIDTGVDYNHEALRANMVAGYDFANNDNDPMDKTGFQNPGHGTHCAGIVGATGQGAKNLEGMSPQVSLMPLRFLTETGSGDLMNAIKSIDFAIEKKVDIISASWGANVPRSQAKPLIEAIDRACKAGILFVAAAGNDSANNDSTETYPANAALPCVISVAATNSSDQKAGFSNFGASSVDLGAPGDAIFSTLPGNKYQNLSGTSMATPLVSGLAALLKAADSSLSAEEAKAALMHSGAKMPLDTACNCRVDAAAAVELVKSGKPFLVPAAMALPTNGAASFTLARGASSTVVEYTSSNPQVAEVSASGVVTAKSQGEAIISAKLSDGSVLKSQPVRVGKQGGGGGEEPPTPGDCPLGDPMLCELMCQLLPELPFCKK
jgi:thermitase